MWLAEFLRRLRFWVRRDRLTDDLDEEMRLHVELRARANRARGLTAVEADAAARRRFGNHLALREQGLEAWGFVFLERLGQDVRYAWRQILRHRGVSVMAMLTLALGIGANSALFTVVNAILLKPAPAARPDELVWVVNHEVGSGRLEPLSHPQYEFLRDHGRIFQDIAAFSSVRLALGGDSPARIAGVIASVDYFDTLGVRAQIGRTFRAEDATATAGGLVAVIADSFWRRAYGGASDVIGRTVVLNARPFTIVGVAPPGFVGLETPDAEVPGVWVPLNAAAVVLPGERSLLTSLDSRWLNVAGRLQSGTSISQAGGVVAALTVSAPRSAGDAEARDGLTVRPIRGGITPYERDEVGAVLWLLMAVPGLVLIVACANVANLLLMRGVSRRRELALRRAIGASRPRLIRQLLTEGALLSIGGGLVALGASRVFIGLIGGLAGVPAPLLGAMTADGRVFAVTMGIAAVSILIFALSPAVSATGSSLSGALKDEGRGNGAAGRRRHLTGAFVVTQIAVALSLLITAGLLLQSVNRTLRVDAGFDVRNALTFSYDLRLQGYGPERVVAFHRRLLEELRAVAGVRAAALANPLPLSGTMIMSPLVPEGRDSAPELSIGLAWISEEYFATLGVPIRQGRAFVTQDAPGAPDVAIVNETLARSLWPDGAAVGKRVRLEGADEPWREIVGIARDSKYETLTEDARPFIYLPVAQSAAGPMSAFVRTRDEPGQLTPAIASVVRALDADLPIYSVATFEQNIAGTVDVHRAASVLLAVFGTMTLLLAAVGVYGVTAHSVSLRTREIGIRMSLGASRQEIIGLFVGQGGRRAVAGLVIGAALSAVAARVLETFLFGLGATDTWTFLGAAGLLSGVVLLASALPARRAARLDPLRALRHD